MLLLRERVQYPKVLMYTENIKNANKMDCMIEMVLDSLFKRF